MFKEHKLNDRVVRRTIRPTYGNIGSILTKFSLYVLNLLGQRVQRHHRKTISAIVLYFSNTLVNEGVDQMIGKMKVSVILLQKYLAGEPMKTSIPLKYWVGVVHGLPRFLPKEARNSIRQGSIKNLRWLISILSTYRGLEGEYGTPDYASIQSPPSERSFRDLHDWFNNFVDHSHGNVKRGYLRIFGMRAASVEHTPIFSSSPNHTISYAGILRDAQIWRAYGKRHILQNYLKSISYLDKSAATALRAFSLLSEYRLTSYERSLPLPIPEGKRKKTVETQDRVHGLGRISLKYEPAGKIRPFAIIDYWTQISLKPLHDSIMKMIGDVFSPMDATYDQFKGCKTFAEEGHENVYSFDLSKATDMIPIRAYEAVLTVLLNKHIAKAWVSLMSEREFLTSEKGKVTGSVRYTRGQPMGAYSSWAMLALFHHCAVQYSHYLVTGNYEMFHGYRVLGDDIVIGDHKVAQSYLKLMTDFGVPIQLTKSFISERVKVFNKKTYKFGPLMNFANQIWLGKTNISPMPFSEYSNASVQGLPALKEIAFRLIRYGWVKEGVSRLRLLTWNASEWKRIQVILNKKDQISDPFVLKLLSYAYAPGADLFISDQTPEADERVPSCGRLLSVLKDRKVSSLMGSVNVRSEELIPLAEKWGNKLLLNLSHMRMKILLWTQESYRTSFCVDTSKQLIPAKGWVGYKSDISDLTAQLDCFYDIQSEIWTRLMYPMRVRAAGKMNQLILSFVGLRSTPHILFGLESILDANRSMDPPKKLGDLKDVDALVKGARNIKSVTPRAWRTGKYLLTQSGFVLPNRRSIPSSRVKKRNRLGKK